MSRNKPYIQIFLKDDEIGHTRYKYVNENGDEYIRGLSTTAPIMGETVYEKGAKDSNGIDINDKQYIAGDKIYLTKEESNIVKNTIKKQDDNSKNIKYNPITNNCIDFVQDVVDEIDPYESVNDFMSEEQKRIALSKGHNWVKDKTPNQLKKEKDITKHAFEREKLQDTINQLDNQNREKLLNKLDEKAYNIMKEGPAARNKREREEQKAEKEKAKKLKKTNENLDFVEKALGKEPNMTKVPDKNKFKQTPKPLNEDEIRELMKSEAYNNKYHPDYEKTQNQVRQSYECIYPDDDRNENPNNYYIWKTSGDSKVRSEHADLDGEVFCWDNPPECGHPGDDYNCRCTAEPYVTPQS